MLIYRTTHRAACAFIAFCFLFVFLFCAPPAARAEPAEESVTGWVDIQAHVPEGFKGSVSVALENKATGETQIVTSYYLNDYSNSVQIPLGEYIVVSAFTSEDSFIYEASTKTEQFVLKDNIKIEVAVTHNPEGENILANIGQELSDVEEPPDEPPVESSDTQPEESEDVTERPSSNPDAQQDEEPVDPSEESEIPEEDGKDKTSSSDAIAKKIRNVLLTVAATLAFFLVTTLLVVYIRCKFGND